MQDREIGPVCSNDEQEHSNPDTSTVRVLHFDSPRDATSFNSSSLNDDESNNSYIAQVPYPHTMLVRPSYWSSAPWRCADDWPTCCITCLCPCITFGQIAKIADGRSICQNNHSVIVAYIVAVKYVPWPRNGEKSSTVQVGWSQKLLLLWLKECTGKIICRGYWNGSHTF